MRGIACPRISHSSSEKFADLLCWNGRNDRALVCPHRDQSRRFQQTKRFTHWHATHFVFFRNRLLNERIALLEFDRFGLAGRVAATPKRLAKIGVLANSSLRVEPYVASSATAGGWRNSFGGTAET